MRKKRILCFLLIVLFVLPIVACGDKEIGTGQKGTETVNNQGTGLQDNREEGTPDGQETASPGGVGISKEEEAGTPSEGELINIIHNAESTLLNLCVEGFDAEFQGTKKKGFDQASGDLLNIIRRTIYIRPGKIFMKTILANGVTVWESFLSLRTMILLRTVLRGCQRNKIK